MMNIHANKIIANKFVGEFENSNNNDGFNVGDIKWSATDLTQIGFLVANGASVRKDTYIDLFNAIGIRWGSVDEEHFNLPNLIGRFAEGNATAGGYKETGLPNIEGIFYGAKTSPSQTIAGGAFFTQNEVSSAGGYQSGNNAGSFKVIFDASRSSHIYGNSDTVQPNSTLLIPYIKAFNGASTSSTDLEITKVANDIADKANRDLTNLSDKGKKVFFPSDTYVDCGTIVSGGTYTAPANGYFCLTTGASAGKYQVLFCNKLKLEQWASASGTLMGYLPIKKGNTITVQYNGMFYELIFIYAEGDLI